MFESISLPLNVTPGQDPRSGNDAGDAPLHRPGLAGGGGTAAGVSNGLLGRSLMAALGSGALPLASEMVFVTVKVACAAYQVVPGLRLALARRS